MSYYGDPYDPADTGESLCRCGQATCKADHAFRVQIIHLAIVLADEMFASSAAGAAFAQWFWGQPDVPRGGASVQMRADMFSAPREWFDGKIPGIREAFIKANYRNAQPAQEAVTHG